MADIKLVIDFFMNTMLRVFNTLKSGMGIYFLVWIAVVFLMPRFRKLTQALKG